MPDVNLPLIGMSNMREAARQTIEANLSMLEQGARYCVVSWSSVEIRCQNDKIFPPSVPLMLKSRLFPDVQGETRGQKAQARSQDFSQ